MNEVKLLTSLELRELYGLHQFRHTKDQKERRRYLGLLATMVFVILVLAFYVGALSVGLVMIGLARALPAYLAFIASLLVLFFGIFKAGGVLFGTQCAAFLCALPIRRSSIILSRFLRMYVEDLLFVLLIFLPGLGVYGVMLRPSLGFYLRAAVLLPFMPLIPLALSVFFGTLISALSARVKRKTAAQTVLSIVVVVGVLLFSFFGGSFAEDLTPEMLTDFALLVETLIGNIYPPAVFAGQGILGLSTVGAWLFVPISLGAAALSLLFVFLGFDRVQARLFATAARHDYKIHTLAGRGRRMALYRRERKRYFASGIYVTNTILSPIMAVLLAVGLMVIGKDALVLPAPLSLDLVGAVPFLLGTVLSMMPTAAVSVSMEGKQFWVAQTLPLSTREILDAKLLWNFTLLAPGYLISEILLTIALRPTPVALLWQWLIPLCFTVLSVVFALRIDLSWCRFDWEKEQTVVKQSASAAIGGLVPTLVGLLLSLPAMLLPRVGGIVYRVCLLATFPLAIWGLYRSCVGRELHKLK